LLLTVALALEYEAVCREAENQLASRLFLDAVIALAERSVLESVSVGMSKQ
jgi:hypothetical protein